MPTESVLSATSPRAVTPPPEHNTDMRHISSPTRYSLHLSDTKTRVRPTLPPDEDAYASRIQLMLYHRLLSNLLATAEPSIPHLQAVDFNLLWERAGVDPQRKFSVPFMNQAGLSSSDDSSTDQSPYLSGLSCLDDLTAAWRHAVEALNIVGIDNTLTLVYRSQSSTRRRPGKGKYKAKDQDERKSRGQEYDSTSLSDQEAHDLAAAIQASINDMQPENGADDELIRAIRESLKDAVRSGIAEDGELVGNLVHISGPPISEMSSFATEIPPGELEAMTSEKSVPTGLDAFANDPDPDLAQALQQSLLPQTDQMPTLKEVPEQSAEADTMDNSRAMQDITSEPMAVKYPHSPEIPVSVEPDGLPRTTPSSPGIPAAVDSPDDEEITEADLETEARIIGRKEFEMDDVFLDDYLRRVLEWWYGQRPPEGVDVELTRRCVYVCFILFVVFP